MTIVSGTANLLGRCFLVISSFYCALLASGCGGGSTPQPPTVSVSVSPKRAAITTGQTQLFSASVTGASDTGVSWEVDTVPGGNATVGTVDANGKYTPPAAGGTHTVTARSHADATKTASASLGVTDLAGVFTYHNNISRDGTNTKEFALTTANVNASTFGKLFSCAVDGAIYAQPLWVANVSIGTAKHNVIVVTTQHESIYAFDADANPCSTLWHVSLLDAPHGGTLGEGPVPSGATGGLVGNGFGDITPEVGITGTPVIDSATNILYVVSKSVIANPTPAAFFQRLHALDLTSGDEKLNNNKPMAISATVSGTGDGSSGGSVPFDLQKQHQRPGLALSNGVVYVSWASHEDADPYHGWIIGYIASTLAPMPNAVFNTSPNGSRSGVWMAGGAPAIDSNGNLYVTTGNGTFDGNLGGADFGDSVLKMNASAGLLLSDSFTPFNQSTLNANDTDLGSGGVVLLPDQPAAPVHLLIAGGKQGLLYLLNRDSLGGYCNGCVSDTNVVQALSANVGFFGTPAFWQNNVYFAGSVQGVGDNLKAYKFTTSTGQFNGTPSSQSTEIYNFPGATPSVSSQGNLNGIVWAIDSSAYGVPCCANGPAILRAYDATNLGNELWNSNTSRDQAGHAVKFTVPTIANGKVYIGTRGNDTVNGGVGELDVYGLLP